MSTGTPGIHGTQFLSEGIKKEEKNAKVRT